MARYNQLTKNIIGLLASGFLLGYIRKGKQKIELLKDCDKAWHSIDRNELFKLLRILRLHKFIKIIKNRDQTTMIELTEKGRRRASEIQLNDLKIKKPKKWDKKWRIVVFDIPENLRKLRNALRFHLKRLGFRELQKSVFVFPYPSKDEITFITNILNLHKYVRYCEAVLFYDDDLRKNFKL